MSNASSKSEFLNSNQVLGEAANPFLRQQPTRFKRDYMLLQKYRANKLCQASESVLARDSPWSIIRRRAAAGGAVCWIDLKPFSPAKREGDITGMSSKFLERLDEIREGAPPRLGFGASRAPKLPGLALVVTTDGGKDGVAGAAGLGPDAVIVSGASPAQASEVGEAASGANWGVRSDGLTAPDANAWREAGADLLVFSLAGTILGAVTSKDAARVLAVDADASPEELRDINPLPVDAVLVSLPGDPAGWKLQDLAVLARVSGRVGKHLLAEVSGAPDGETLEALRNSGVAGLVIDLSAGKEVINGLKDSLVNMPRPGSDSRSRSNAILPGSVYADRRPAPAEPDPDDD